MNNLPKKFVGLHGHCGFSPYDGLGYPNEHFEWCIENGLDAHTLSEHGHLNSYAHAALWAEDWNKKNKEKLFKHIPGVEAYFHPDLEQWKRDKEHADKVAADKKLAKKEKKRLLEENKTLINVTSDGDDETIDIANQLTIENEDESKSNKFSNPVNRRHHLVLLPKNQQGLLEIFQLTSKGYLEGFYRFPRIDLRMIREVCKNGNVIASSACIHPDAIIHTNFGQLTMKEVVDKCNQGFDVFVLSYDTENKKASFERVTWADKTRLNAKLVQIKLKNGKSLKLTPDHKVYTNHGWKEAQDLKTTDSILAIP